MAGALAFSPARLLEPGETVTVVVPPRERSNVALTYESEVWGRWSRRRKPRLSDSHHSVRFTACPDEQPHTQFTGGFLVRWPRCARLEVFSRGERLETALPFGERCS